MYQEEPFAKCPAPWLVLLLCSFITSCLPSLSLGFLLCKTETITTLLVTSENYFENQVRWSLHKCGINASYYKNEWNKEMWPVCQHFLCCYRLGVSVSINIIEECSNLLGAELSSQWHKLSRELLDLTSRWGKIPPHCTGSTIKATTWKACQHPEGLREMLVHEAGQIFRTEEDRSIHWVRQPQVQMSPNNYRGSRPGSGLGGKDEWDLTTSAGWGCFYFCFHPKQLINHANDIYKVRMQGCRCSSPSLLLLFIVILKTVGGNSHLKTVTCALHQRSLALWA